MHQIRLRLDPAGGAYSAPPDPLAGFNGPISKGGEGRGGQRKGAGRESGGKRRIGEGEGREENGDRPPTIFGLKVALKM